MGHLTQMKKQQIIDRMNKRKKRIKLLLIVGAAVILGTVLISKIGQASMPVLEANALGNVEVPTSGLSTKGSFYRHEHEGVMMEFFILEDQNGTVRMAFNRCQVCYESGRGYFVQKGEYFVCQNCGNKYHFTAIGTEKGGCNPSPIFPSDRLESTNSIDIKPRIFDENKYLFQ